MRNHQTIISLLFVFCLIASGGFYPLQAAEFQTAEAVTVQSTVTEEDCRKCHENIVLILERKGEAHKQLCMQCHQGHPPADMEIVPACSRCHQGEEHFSLQGCINCHADPHKPLEIHLTKKITAPCLTCHSEQAEQLKANPSIHSLLQCTACHYYHGQIQPCRNCHLPHSDTMGQESCLFCHKAHMPLAVTYGEDIPSDYCGSCHEEVYATIAVTWSKHRNVKCVRCHAGSHGKIPQCQDCHGIPHPEDIWGKFDQCNDCHDIAHDLWASEASTNRFVIEDRRKNKK
ncbi:MAG: hypothetical protein KQH63_15340 [Desulfobulbaceae bacterium]|nr:hypothetical protein [Desulfobulbaceae bacterium]